MPDLTTIHSVKEIPARLAVLIDALEAACQSAEPDFLKVGEELRSVKADTDLMTQQIHAAVDFIEDAIERDALRSVRTLAGKSMAEIKRIRDKAEQDLKHMLEVAQRMGAINRLCAGTETITTFLRVISFNMAVKSAHSRIAQETFKGFAEEAKKVASSFSTLTGQLGADSQTVQTAQLSAHTEISADSVMLQGLAHAADSTLQSAVGASEQLMAHSRNVLENAGIRSQTIAQQVSEIVVSVQYHDSMSQRIAHICENLRKIVTVRNDETQNGKTHQFNRADSLLNRQSAELHLIITELDCIYHKNIQAFEKIDSEAERLAQSLDIYDNPDSLSGAQDLNPLAYIPDAPPVKTVPDDPDVDPFGALKTALKSLYELLCKGQELTEQIEKSVAYADTKTSRFAIQARKVHRIGYEAHIMALNAGVKASKLGNQRQTFAVMAQEITSLARQSQAFVTDIETILKSVGALNLKAQTNLPEQIEPGQSGAITMLDDHIQAVSDAFHQFKIKSSEAYQLVGILRKKIVRVKTGLSFLPALADELITCKHLTELLGRIAEAWKRKERELTSDEIETIVQQYKVQPNQDVLRQPGRQKDHTVSPGIPDHPPSSTFSTDDNLGDNIDLF